MNTEEAGAWANQLLSHYGKQSWDAQYRANAPVYDPAKHILVKDAQQFIAMAERRGYGPAHEERDEQGWLCWLNSDYVGRCYIREDFFLYQTVAVVANEFDKWFGDLQHHVCCGQCKEPLLIGSSRKMTLDLYQRRTRPSLTLQVDKAIADEVIRRLRFGLSIPKDIITVLPDTSMDEAIAKSTGYRSARLGPDSPMLSVCPGCGIDLGPESVGEIED